MITNFPKGGASEKVKLFPNFKLFPNLGGGGGGLEIWEVFPKNTASLILTASLSGLTAQKLQLACWAHHLLLNCLDENLHEIAVKLLHNISI